MSDESKPRIRPDGWADLPPMEPHPSARARASGAVAAPTAGRVRADGSPTPGRVRADGSSAAGRVRADGSSTGGRMRADGSPTAGRVRAEGVGGERAVSGAVAPSPLDPGATRNPYRVHRVLREEFPLTYDPLLRAWVLSRYADVATALTDARFTHGHRPGDPPCARTHTDVDEHELRSVIARTAHVLARRIADRPQADLVADFCRRLPAGTVAAAIGVPYRDMMRLVRGRAAAALAGQCTAQISVREKALASFLANVLAGPDHVRDLHTAPSGQIARAWTESLRRDPPVQIAVRRTAAEVRVSGGTIPAGEPVALLIGAACRDPERFRDPDRYHPLRDDPGQLTYGSGDCPAVRLAGLEAEYALRALLDVMPRLRFADGFRPERTGLITRAPRSLLVRPGG